jgi:AcrR family transcriptional regulator
MATDTRDTILQVARRLFVQQGYTATSMRQVAEEAGIGKATIYHHFPDKQTIVMAILEKNIGQMDEALKIVQAEADPHRRIQVAAEISIGFLFESADIQQIVRREVPAGRDRIQSGFVAFLKEYMALLADAIQRGIEQGIFRPVDPKRAARVFMTMIQGTFANVYITGDRSWSPAEAAAALLDTYFHGIDVR